MLAPLLVLFVLAIAAFVLGFAVAAHWLFILAVVLLVVGLVVSFSSRGTRRW